jgi:hypothetical protein
MIKIHTLKLISPTTSIAWVPRNQTEKSNYLP